MPKSPAEPTNLVLEHLRLLRQEMTQGFEAMSARFDTVETDIAGLKREVRGFKLNTIAEIYKANLTVASLVDLERRVAAPEEKAP